MNYLPFLKKMITDFLYQIFLVLLIFTILCLFIYNAAIRFKNAKEDLANQGFSKKAKARLTFNLFANSPITAWFIFLTFVFLYTLITKWRPW